VPDVRHPRPRKFVTSGFTWDERKQCNYSCTYCFAAESDYHQSNIDSIDDFVRRVAAEGGSSIALIQLGHDTEFFQNQKAALDILQRLSAIRCLIALATKMPLQGRVLDSISEADATLKSVGGLLTMMVSIPVLWRWREVEPGLPSPWRRLSLLEELSNRGITAVLGIRPLLPPRIMSDSEVISLATSAKPWLQGVIFGPYWFREDRWSLIGDPAVKAVSPRWMRGPEKWFRYEVAERNSMLASSLKDQGIRVYDSVENFFLDRINNDVVLSKNKASVVLMHFSRMAASRLASCLSCRASCIPMTSEAYLRTSKTDANARS
jgi:DNA repair photolyase